MRGGGEAFGTEVCDARGDRALEGPWVALQTVGMNATSDREGLSPEGKTGPRSIPPFRSDQLPCSGSRRFGPRGTGILGRRRRATLPSFERVGEC